MALGATVPRLHLIPNPRSGRRLIPNPRSGRGIYYVILGAGAGLSERDSRSLAALGMRRSALRRRGVAALGMRRALPRLRFC